MGKFLEAQFETARAIPSDINEHIALLRFYAQQCRTILEFGVRSAVSTRALLVDNPDTYVGVDLVHNMGADEFIKAARGSLKNSGKFLYILADTTKLSLWGDSDLPATFDMLFIDTRHDYEVCIVELMRTAPFINKFIALHDTETFGYHGETTPEGLRKAITEFLTTEEGMSWRVRQIDSRQNGLTVLERNPARDG